MDSGETYRHLKDIAEKLNVQVTEENLKQTGPRVKSGFCRVRDKQKFILDKHIPTREKNEILATFIAGLPLDAIYIVPAVREYIELCSGRRFETNNDRRQQP